MVPLGQQPKDFIVIGSANCLESRSSEGGNGNRETSLASFLLDRPEPSTRTLEAKVAGTSTTRSPASTSCWDSK